MNYFSNRLLSTNCCSSISNLDIWLDHIYVKFEGQDHVNGYKMKMFLFWSIDAHYEVTYFMDARYDVTYFWL